MQAHVQFFRQAGACAHDLWGDRERRAWRQGDLDLGAVATFVVAVDKSLAVGQDDLALLYRLLRRQAAIGLAQAHRAAGEHGAHAQFAHCLDLHVDGVVQALREQVVVVGGGGATRQQQFGQGDFAGQCQFAGGQARPDGIQGFQPGEQRLVHHRGPGPGQGLVEVVVGIDQARQHHVLAGIEDVLARGAGALAARQKFTDAAILDDQAATGIAAVGREDGKGGFQPGAGRRHGAGSSESGFRVSQLSVALSADPGPPRGRGIESTASPRGFQFTRSGLRPCS